MTTGRPRHRSASDRHGYRCTMALPILLAALAALASGCRPEAYFADRWADAKDVFTVSVGKGGGAKARVGPVNAGLFVNGDIAGLRGGEFFHYGYGFLEGGPADGVMVLGLGGEVFDLVVPPPPVSSELWHRMGQPSQEASRALAERGKSYRQTFFPRAPIEFPREPYYYTQLEVAAGVYGTLRLGFNPGELLDFVLGWTTLDIFGDDARARRAQEEVGVGESEGVPVRPWSPGPVNVPPSAPAPAPTRPGPQERSSGSAGR